MTALRSFDKAVTIVCVYVGVCVCVCVCMCECMCVRERDRERESLVDAKLVTRSFDICLQSFLPALSCRSFTVNMCTYIRANRVSSKAT